MHHSPTKFSPPQVHAVFRRKRLENALESSRKKRFTLLHAAGGWGKTVCLAGWLRSLSGRHLWINLDQSDRDPQNFILALAQGLSNTLAESRTDIDRLLKRNRCEGAPPAMTLQSLFRIVLDHSSPLLLILDDFHIPATEKLFLDLSSQIISLAPYNLHTMLVTRVMPDIPLSRYKLYGEMTEFTAKELAFDGRECMEFFSSSNNLNPDAATVDRILATTAGWPVGLRLLSETVGMNDFQALEQGLGRMEESGSAFATFFKEEIFTHLAPDLQDFLLKTAPFEWFTPQLCNAVLERSDSSDMIRDLFDHGLFIYRFDHSDGRHRYHQLFREFLLKQASSVLGNETVHQIQRLAGRALSGEGLWRDALTMFLAGKDAQSATVLLEHNIESFVEQTSVRDLDAWLKALPEDAIRSSPGLLLARGWVDFASGKRQTSLDHLQNARSLALKQNDANVLGKVFFYELFLLFTLERHQEMVRLSREGMALFPEKSSPYALCARMQALALAQLGRLDEAGNLWVKLKNHPLTVEDEHTAMLNLPFMGLNYSYFIGDLVHAQAVTERGINFFRGNNYFFLYERLLGYLAVIHHDMGEYEQCEREIREVCREMHDKGHLVTHVLFLCLRAVNAVCMNDLELSSRCLDNLQSYPELPSPEQNWKGYLLPLAKALLSKARNNAQEFFCHADQAMSMVRDRGTWLDLYTTTCLLAPGYAAFGREDTAVDALGGVVKECAAIGACYPEARARLILAGTLHKMGRKAEGATHLNKAIALSAQHHFDCLFLKRERECALALLPRAELSLDDIPFAAKMLTALHQGSGQALFPMLNHPQPQFRAAALQALADNACRDAEKAIHPLLKDKDSRVQEAAGAALERLRNLPPLPLQVRVLGRFDISVGNQPLDRKSWKRKSALGLFRYLLLHAGRDIPAEVLMDTLFGSSGPDEARAQLHQAVSTIRKILEPGIAPKRESAYLKAGDGVYRLELPQDSFLDTARFEALLRKAARAKTGRDHRLAHSCLEQALDLYGGELMPDAPYEEWIQPKRDSYRGMAARALFELARSFYDRNDYTATIATLKRLLQLEPWDEAAVLLLMKAYLGKNDRARAIKAYQEIRLTLEQELGLSPGPELNALHTRITA